MGWLGKVVGGGIGFVMGGPLGALIGAGLGHTLLDGSPTGRMSPAESRQTVFFTAVFAMLGKMAKADGRVSQEEVAVVERFMRDQLRLDADARRLAISIFNRAKEDPTSFEAYARQFGRLFAGEPHLRAMLFELLADVALADGGLDRAEDRILREALDPLGLPRHVYERVVNRAGKATLQDHYALLGVSEDASDDEVKRAFRKACREHHPDAVIAKGLPEEFLKVAEEKFKQVTVAYEAIQAHRKTRAAR